MATTTTRRKSLQGLWPRKFKARRKRTTLKSGAVSESVIQSQILDWLKVSGILHWRQNSGTMFFGSRRIRLGEEGLPDIIVIVPPTGRFLGLEVKSEKGTLRESQEKFRDRLAQNGGRYYVVRTLQQAMETVAKEFGKEAASWKVLQQSSSVLDSAPLS